MDRDYIQYTITWQALIPHYRSIDTRNKLIGNNIRTKSNKQITNVYCNVSKWSGWELSTFTHYGLQYLELIIRQRNTNCSIADVGAFSIPKGRPSKSKCRLHRHR